MMAGILKPLSGEIVVDGTDIHSLSAKQLDSFRRRHIGLVFQRPHLIKSLTVSENLVLAQSFAGLEKVEYRIAEVTESLGIVEKLKALQDQLNRGQLERVSIVREVVNHPPVFIADEPSSIRDNRDVASLLIAFRTIGKHWIYTDHSNA